MSSISFLLSVFSLGLETVFLTGEHNEPMTWVFIVFINTLAGGSSVYWFNKVNAKFELSEKPFSDRFVRHLLIIGMIPVAGPVGIYTICLILKFYPAVPLPFEEFEFIDQDYIETYSKDLKEYSFFNINPGSIIHNEISFEEASWNLQTLDQLEWFPYKTKFLQLFLEYSKHPSIIVEASRIINHKKDLIIKEIRQAELEPEKDCFCLAELNYEIYHLCLVCPPLDKFYLDKACRYILEAVEQQRNNPDIYHFAIKYHLQNNLVETAEKLLEAGGKIFQDNSRFQLIADIFGQEIQFKKNGVFS